MTTLPRLGPLPEDFLWASGIEDTFVPQTRPGHRALDEYQLLGHYQHWREDLALGCELGLKAIRWGVPWYRVEPLPGEFDWRWTDEVIPYLVEELGITPIIDLMHYGCPFWMYHEFINPDYPALVARYAAAFAERYGRWVRWYTPLNEPLVNSAWCGQRGIWPPYLRGDRGYLRVMLQLARGIQQTVNALKAVDPEAVMFHVEATGISRSGEADFQPRVAREQVRGFLCYDLITGRVTPEHPLFDWLTTENGFTPKELAAIALNPIALDVIGLNFYPQWSTKEIRRDKHGKPVYKVVDKTGTGFARLVETYYDRYQAPIVITETSARGSSKVRMNWLDTSLAAIKEMRGRGVPVLGYTWFPMFTMFDWKYRLGRAPLEKYRLELGFYRLGSVAHRWEKTDLVERWRSYVSNPADAIGILAETAPPM
jgi:beta-glucosidase/6-phospho-beta-glucosidase/beta-galactosidase